MSVSRNKNTSSPENTSAENKVRYEKMSQTAGLAPGTPIPVAIDASAPSQFVVTLLQDGKMQTATLAELDDSHLTAPAGSTLWLDVQGPASLKSIRKIFNCLNLHPLFREDVLNAHQRSKFEVWEGALLLVTKRLYYNSSRRVRREQVSFLAKGNIIVSFQPPTSDSFAGVRKRLPLFKDDKTEPSYVLYALLDNLVDNYFAVFERLEASIEATEKQLLASDMPLERTTLSYLKHDVTTCRHVIWPLKNMLVNMSDDKEDFFPSKLDPYLADLKDHIDQLYEACDICSDYMSSIIQLNMDNINNRTNEIMKVLALISTVFLPLTFIAGVYGMNFEFMPELKSQWGYPTVLAVMVIIAIFLYRSFKTRKWI